MPTLDVSITDILARLRTMDRRLLGLMAAGAMLFLYFVALGFQYWGEVQRNYEFMAQEQTLLRSLAVAGRVEPPDASEIQAAETQWELTSGQYTYGHPDEMYAAVTDAVRRGRVSLGSISNTTDGAVEHSGIRYDVHRVNLRVSGSLNNIRNLLVELGTVAPVTVSSINLTGLGADPTATLNLRFTTNPRPANGGW